MSAEKLFAEDTTTVVGYLRDKSNNYMGYKKNAGKNTLMYLGTADEVQAIRFQFAKAPDPESTWYIFDADQPANYLRRTATVVFELYCNGRRPGNQRIWRSHMEDGYTISLSTSGRNHEATWVKQTGGDTRPRTVLAKVGRKNRVLFEVTTTPPSA